MLGIDRKEMEEKRLAREAAKRKREASISPPPMPRNRAHPQKKARPETAEQPPKAQSQFDQQQIRPVSLATSPVVSRLSSPPASGLTKGFSPPNTTKVVSQAVAAAVTPLEYPDGAVKRTFSMYHERSKDIKFEEVIQKNSLRTAVFMSFQWDLDWLFSKIDMRNTKIVLVMGVNSKAEETIYRQQAADQGLVNVRLCFPTLLTRGNSIMHSKLMLLFYETHMRVVVPTANLVDYDWGERGLVENTVFLIDLPRRRDGSQGTTTNLTPFGRSLRSFLQCMNMQENVLNGMMNFDYSKTTHLGFVYSAAGEHTFDPAASPPDLNIGYMGLHRAVNNLQLDTTQLHLDYTTSSLGLLDSTLLQRIHTAAQAQPTHTTGSFTAPGNSFNVYFPSTQTVQESMGGPDNAGTICLRSKHIHNRAFQRDVLRDHRSTRIGLLSHSKIMFARGLGARDVVDGEEKRMWTSWAYVGSANLTASAWGTIAKVGKGAAAKEVLMCRNWECGVIVPAGLIIEYEPLGPSEEGVPELKKMFEGFVDVPFDEEETSYSGKEPWLFDTHA